MNRDSSFQTNWAPTLRGRRTAYRQPGLRIEDRQSQKMPPPKPVEKNFTNHSVGIAIKNAKAVAKPKVASEFSSHTIVQNPSSKPVLKVTLNDQRLSKKQKPLNIRANARRYRKQARREVIKHPLQSLRRISPGKIAYNVLTVALMVAGGGILVQSYKANHTVDQQVAKLEQAAQKAETASTTPRSSADSIPVYTKPEANYLENYKVGPTLPRIIRIPKIGVTARILQVGVDDKGRIDVPKTAYDTAWYNGSAAPGANGAMLIDAHVRSIGGSAVFGNLHKLVKNDVITVEKGDGEKLQYIVKSIELVGVGELDVNKILMSVDDTKPGLNLITCAGTYDSEANQFDQRTIVYAVQQ